VLEGKRATADDLWITDLLPQIADYCERDIRRQLKERGEKEATVEEIEPKMESFKVFNATWKALYFTFPSGFVTANYLGSFTVEMPVETLSGMGE